MGIKATVDSKSYSGIESIEVGGKTIALEETYTGTKTITTNGSYDVSGYANAEVNVPTEGDSFTLQEKTVTKNGEVTPDSGYDGLSKVTVNVPEKEVSLQNKTVTENGTYTADSGYDGLGQVTVNVPQNSGDDEFVGIKYSDFDTTRGTPKVADASRLPILDINLAGSFAYLFACSNKNPNGGWNALLEDVYVPDGITEIAMGMFLNSGKVPTIHGDLSKITTISGMAYQYSNIEKFDYNLPSLTSIGANAFNSCTSFNILALRTNNLVSLVNINALTNSGIYKGTGYVFVPQSLKSQYEQATNWATLVSQNANVFKALEDYTVDGTITGALDETKLSALGV